MGLITVISTYLAVAGFRACRKNEDVVDVVISDYNKVKSFTTGTVDKVKNSVGDVKNNISDKLKTSKESNGKESA